MRRTITSVPKRSRATAITGCTSGHHGSSTVKGGNVPRISPVASHRISDTRRPAVMEGTLGEVRPLNRSSRVRDGRVGEVVVAGARHDLTVTAYEHHGSVRTHRQRLATI